jgi:hypothetical protein
MRSLIAHVDADIVIPTCEEVFWLAEAAARDGYSGRLFAPPLDVLRILHSKALFPEFAAKLGLHSPETYVLDAAIRPETLPLPLKELVLKPEFSRFGTHTRIAPSRADISAIHPAPARRWVAQRRIWGDEFCSWAALHDGKVMAFAAYRPRWRQGRAAAFQIEAVDIPAIRDITERVAQMTGMTGHLSFDVVVDRDGRAWPIECNPRAVSGLHLFDASSELGRALVAQRACPPPSPGTLRHLSPAMALLGLPAALMQRRLPAFLADWRAGKDVVDREGNPLLLLGCLADAVGFAAQALRSGRSASAATTADIEWDGEPIA